MIAIKRAAFGMVMPERAYNADKYRWGFNGKENDNEVKGDGNSLDFGARIYDSRLGRWLSVDPLATKYPYITPYNFTDNNSILFTDLDGRKTTYYMYNMETKKYVIVFKSKDNLPNGITIINPSNNEQFMDMLTEAQSYGKNIHNDYFNKTLRQQGITYLTDDMDRLNQYSTVDKKSGFYDPKTLKEMPLKSEYSNYMVLNKDGNVEVDDKSQDRQGDASMVDFGDAPSNAVSKIHSHPEAGTIALKPYGSAFRKGTLEGTPSSTDDYHTANPGYYNVVTSPQGACFYNYQPTQGEERRPNLTVPKKDIPR